MCSDARGGKAPSTVGLILVQALVAVVYSNKVR